MYANTESPLHPGRTSVNIDKFPQDNIDIDNAQDAFSYVCRMQAVMTSCRAGRPALKVCVEASSHKATHLKPHTAAARPPIVPNGLSRLCIRGPDQPVEVLKQFASTRVPDKIFE